MGNKVLIFPDPEDFLQFMDQLQEEYNKTHEEGAVNNG